LLKKRESQVRVSNPALKPNTDLKRGIREWCEKRAVELRTENTRLSHLAGGGAEAATAASAAKVHVFVDYSNLVGKVSRGDRRGTVSIGKVVRLILGSSRRTIEQRVVVGSANSPEAEWARWRELGYVTIVDPRRGRETNVDEALVFSRALT
jgi:hypothetical protein